MLTLRKLVRLAALSRPRPYQSLRRCDPAGLPCVTPVCESAEGERGAASRRVVAMLLAWLRGPISFASLDADPIDVTNLVLTLWQLGVSFA